MSTISIIGSGGMAAAIASVARRAGHRVEIISRDLSKAQALARQTGPGVIAGTFGASPIGDMVVLAVPYTAVLDVVARLGKGLASKILIDITNPVGSDLKSFVVPADSSGAWEIAKVAPVDAHVVKAFNTQFSHVLVAGSFNGQPLDVFIAADDVAAKSHVATFIESLQMRALDTGPLSMARTLEHMCLLSLGLMAHALGNTQFAIGVSLQAESTAADVSYHLAQKDQ